MRRAPRSFDPGVGTARRPLAVQAAGHLFLGPDNGLLAPLLGGQIVEIGVPWRTICDVAAPYLARGVELAKTEQGIEVAQKRGDIQAAKEMRVFLKRLTRD